MKKSKSVFVLLFVFSWMGGACGQTTGSASIQCEYASGFDTLRKFQLSSGKNSIGYGGFVDTLGQIFVTGAGADADNKAHWFVIRSKDQGETWETVDDQAANGGSTKAVSGMVDQTGRIFVTGMMFDADGQGDWVIRRSTNDGKTWDEMDRFRRGADGAQAGYGLSMVQVTEEDDVTRFYSCGGAKEKDSEIGWLVRTSKSGDKSSFDGTDDDYRKAAKKRSLCQRIISSESALYAVGYGVGDQDQSFGIVRKKKLGEKEWKTVDDFALASNKDTLAYSITVHGDVLYWVGAGTKSDESVAWVVRKSTDGGTQWETVDEYQMASKKTSIAQSVVIGADGSIFVAGYGTTSGDKTKWVVRRSQDAGKTWEVYEDYALTSGKNAAASDLFLDDLGHLYVSGYGTDSSDQTHMMVRKLACQTGEGNSQ